MSGDNKALLQLQGVRPMKIWNEADIISSWQLIPCCTRKLDVPPRCFSQQLVVKVVLLDFPPLIMYVIYRYKK